MTSSSCLWKQQTFLPAKLVQSLHHWCPQNLFWATQSSFNIILAQSYFKITLFKIRWNTSWLFIDNETSDSTISGQDISYSIVVNNEMLTDDHFHNLTLQLFLRLKLFYLSILMTDLKLSCLKKFTEKYNNKMMHDLILNSSSKEKSLIGKLYNFKWLSTACLLPLWVTFWAHIGPCNNLFSNISNFLVYLANIHLSIDI